MPPKTNKTVWTLLINKEENEIEVKKLKEFQDGYFQELLETLDVYPWNRNVFLSLSKKSLIELGNSIKNDWIQEAKEAIIKLTLIELK